MVPGVVGSSPISHPRQSRGSGSPRSPISFHIGASPSGKARDFDSLIRWFESSRPSQIIRAGQRRFIKDHDPVAQSAEQLPFKQWVRGSNPRRVTTSSRTAYRSRRLFYKKSSLTHSVAPPFRIEPASLGFDSVWVQTWKLNEIRFSNNFFEKRISSFRKALQ